MKRLGERIRNARERKGITQLELVELMGLSDRSALSEYENGHRKLPAAQLPQLADVLDVPITYFFLGEDSSMNEREAALIEWFRRIPVERQYRFFEWLESVRPLIIGE